MCLLSFCSSGRSCEKAEMWYVLIVTGCSGMTELSLRKKLASLQAEVKGGGEP